MKPCRAIEQSNEGGHARWESLSIRTSGPQLAPRSRQHRRRSDLSVGSAALGAAALGGAAVEFTSASGDTRGRSPHQPNRGRDLDYLRASDGGFLADADDAARGTHR